MWTDRTELLIKQSGIECLKSKNILVVGIGGVGAYAAECICRAGIGSMTIIDGDTVTETNINRQLIAMHSTIGRPKTEVMKERISDINPSINLTSVNMFLEEENISELLDSQHFDYIIDAIDTLSPKVSLCINAFRRSIPIISSMGAGGRIDPTKLRIDDISKTYNDKLAAAFRQKLRHEGIFTGLKVVFSTEIADNEAILPTPDGKNQKSVRGTISYIPPMFGCMIAGTVISDILKKEHICIQDNYMPKSK